MANNQDLRAAKVELLPSPGKIIRRLEQAIADEAPRGFFTTPGAVIGRMLAYAELSPTDTALEPSAGKGNIADIIRPLVGRLLVIESHPLLQQILTFKGHMLAGSNFLDYQGTADVILANPPFGNYNNPEDLWHLYHAYKYCLNKRGRLVFVICERSFVSDDETCNRFRAWLKDVGALIDPLPPGSFLLGERPTQVNARLVVIRK
jgi:hypothetical protein